MCGCEYTCGHVHLCAGDQRLMSGLSWSFSTLHIEAGSFADPSVAGQLA